MTVSLTYKLLPSNTPNHRQQFFMSLYAGLYEFFFKEIILLLTNQITGFAASYTSSFQIERAWVRGYHRCSNPANYFCCDESIWLLELPRPYLPPLVHLHLKLNNAAFTASTLTP